MNTADNNRTLEGASQGEIFGWCLYDWANSAFATTVLAAVLPIYFTYVVPKDGLRLALPGGTVWTTQAPSLWGYAVSLSLLLVALSSPILGTIADRTTTKKQFLAVYAFGGSLCTALLFFVRQGDVWLCLLLFILANIGFSGGNVFYNAFLPQMVGPDKVDRISGRGFAFGYLGGGLLLALNMVMIQKPSLFGLPDHLLATRLCFVSVGLWWGFFAVPSLILLRERAPEGEAPLPGNLLSYSFRRVFRTIKKARRFSQLFRFLIAFLIYNDGIQTVIVMAAIFGRTELKLDPVVLLATLLMIQIVGIPGAIVFARLAERHGGKKTLMFALFLWSSIVCYAYFMQTTFEFVALSALVGTILGGSQAISRSLYAHLVPVAHSAEFFGFYAISSKFAAILGPLVFGLMADLTGNIRLSILAITLFFLGGLLLLATVDVEKGREQAGHRFRNSTDL